MSSEVSFTVAAVLALAGAYCIRKATRTDRSLLPIAIIPLVFAVQQFCEGCVWIGVARGDPTLTRVAATTFLFFALLFWPVWIPFSMLLVERSPRRRLALGAITWIAVLLGLALMVPVIADPGLPALQVRHHSIHYNITHSRLYHLFPSTLWRVLYLAVIAIPLFVSSVPRMIHCGVAAIVTAAATYVLFRHAFASVWCFCAAALSAYLCFLFRRYRGSSACGRPSK